MTTSMIPEKTPDLIWRSLDDGTVVINPELGDVKVLNEVGARAWELVDGISSTSQIAQVITLDYEISLDEVTKDLWDFFSQMIDEGLLQWHEQNG